MATNEILTLPVKTWAKNDPLSLATLLGGVIYAVVFESYRSVLRPLGVTPTDVGIGYIDVIWPVVQGLGFFVFCLTGIAAVALRSPKSRALVVQSPERQAGR